MTKVETLPRLGPAPQVEVANLQPVKWWASLGAAFVALDMYVFTRWVLSDNFRSVPSGKDPIPGWMRVSAHVQEAAYLLLAAVCIYWFVIRQRRRNGRLSIIGMLCLTCVTFYWQDVFNIFNYYFTYNPALVNRGSWYNFIPFWVAPKGESLAEPFLWSTVYFVYFTLGTLIGVKIMRIAKARWPNAGVARLYGIAVLGTFLLDLTAEIVWIRTGIYSYVGAIPELTLFAGKYYQVPVYTMFIWAALSWAPISCLVYFADDKGQTIVERGLERLKLSSRRKGAVRFLAIAGFMNAVVLSYNLSLGMISLMPAFRWSEDIVENRSYFRSNICGEGTEYACPGSDLPIPRKGGSHIGPDGDLILRPSAESNRYE